MLSTTSINTILQHVTYKPGWTFTAWDHPWEGTWITIRAEVPNAYHPDQTITLNIRTAVPPIPDEHYLLDWFAYRLGRIELHEMREYLRIGGQPVSDPHQPDVA